MGVWPTMEAVKRSERGWGRMAGKHRVGLLNGIQYVLVVVLVVAALAWNEYLVIPLVMSIVALPYAVWCAIATMEQDGSASGHREEHREVARAGTTTGQRQRILKPWMRGVRAGSEEGPAETEEVGGGRSLRPYGVRSEERKIA